MAYDAWCVIPLLKWRLQHAYTVFSRNFFECLQPEISSFLLFRASIAGLEIVKYFSHKHKFFGDVCIRFCLLYFAPFDSIFYVLRLSVKLQIYLLSSVACLFICIFYILFH